MGMMHHRWAGWGMWVTAAVLSSDFASAQTQPPSRPPQMVTSKNINRSLLDGSGTLWGAGQEKGTLYRWENNAWKTEVLAPAVGAQVEVLRSNPDGAVLCLWKSGDFWSPSGYILTEHKGSTSRLVARWDAAGGRTPADIFRGRTGLWMTGRGASIYRIENGTARKLFEATKAQLLPSRDSSGGGTIETISIKEDAHGRTYFWTQAEWWQGNVEGLRGMLVFNGRVWKHYPHLPGVPDKQIAFFVPRDSSSFWLGIRESGLYVVDSATMQGRKVPEPFPTAFRDLQGIGKVDGVWHLFADSPETKFPVGDQSLRTGDLWRLVSTTPQGTGWKRIFRGLDYGSYFGGRGWRPIVSTAQGWWLPAWPGGLWWFPRPKGKSGVLPDGSNAVRLDWHYGFNMRSPENGWRQPDGRIAIISGGVVIPDVRPYLKVAPATKPDVWRNLGYVMQDFQHHIWRVPSRSERWLLEWDGIKWRRHAIPADFDLTYYF